MRLSNTETPQYYREFRDQVIAGTIPVCEEISLEMNRIDALIANPGVYYSPDVVEGFINFCENELTTTDGSDINMLPSFKLWAEQLLGWYYYIDKSIYEPYKNRKGGKYVRKRILKRLTKKQYLIVGRGAAKSMYASFIHAYFLTVDTSATEQVAVAPTMPQAEETLSSIKTAITRARGPLFKFLTGSDTGKPLLASTKKGVEAFITNSIVLVKPMQIDKLQGLRPKVSTVDEWLSTDIRADVVGALEQGASKMDDYIIIAISSEGTVRNNCGDTIKMELADILKGKYVNPHVSIFYYKLDKISEVAYPELWVKANPNIGLTVSYEAYELDVKRAEVAPATRNDILAKRFGIPMEGYSYYFTTEETVPHLKKRDYMQMACSLGIDLSQGDDFCAFTFLFPLPYTQFGIKTRAYITERTFNLLQSALHFKYEQFINEGTLIVMDGSILNMMAVYDDLWQHIEHYQYDICTVGYDPYNATEFIDRWKRENGEYAIEKVIQGAKTESVPLGEIKKLSEDRSLLFDEELMGFAMGNAITLEDTNGNRKLMKMRRDEKIDNVAALIDAYVAYKLHTDEF